MDLSIYLRYYSAAGIYFSFRWGPFVHSLETVQWDSTRRDHPGNLGGVSGSGPVRSHRPEPESRSGSRTGVAGREFRSGWADDVLPLPPAWVYEARLFLEAEISWYRD